MDNEEIQRKIAAAKQEGLLEGEKKKAMAIAKSLKEMTVLTLKEISAATGLPLDEIVFIITDKEIEQARLESEFKYEMDLQSFVTRAMRNGWDGHDVRVYHAKNLKERAADSDEKIAYLTGLSLDEITWL
jgi:hypothetical protein